MITEEWTEQDSLDLDAAIIRDRLHRYADMIETRSAIPNQDVSVIRGYADVTSRAIALHEAGHAWPDIARATGETDGALRHRSVDYYAWRDAVMPIGARVARRPRCAWCAERFVANPSRPTMRCCGRECQTLLSRDKRRREAACACCGQTFWARDRERCCSELCAAIRQRHRYVPTRSTVPAGRKPRSECRNGHPYAVTGTRRKGKRVCRLCEAIRSWEWQIQTLGPDLYKKPKPELSDFVKTDKSD